MNKKLLVLSSVLLFMFIITPAFADSQTYTLVEGKYYEVNRGGWFTHRSGTDLYIYFYDDINAIENNNTLEIAILVVDEAYLTEWGWELTWKGGDQFQLYDEDDEIYIKGSYELGGNVNKSFEMDLDDSTRKRFIQDEEDKVCVELLDVYSGGYEFQIYNRYGKQQKWENRQRFNLTEYMIFNVDAIMLSDNAVNCTVQTTTDELKVSVWTQWDTAGEETDEDEIPEAKSVFNVTILPEEPEIDEVITIRLEEDLGFTSFWIYDVIGSGSYNIGENTTTSVDITFNTEGTKTVTLAGEWINGTKILSEHNIKVVASLGAPPPETPPPQTIQAYDPDMKYYVGGGLFLIGIFLYAIKAPQRIRRKYRSIDTCLGIPLDEVEAPELKEEEK